YFLNLRSAVPAPLCRNRNRHRALRTIFRRWSRRCRWFCHPLVHHPHQQEHRKRNNQEIDDRVKQNAVIKSRRSRRLGCCQRLVGLVAQVHKQIQKAHVPQHPPKRRHQDVIHGRRYDFAERRADNDAHRHIHHVATHRKLFKFLQHSSSLSYSLRRGFPNFAESLTHTPPLRATPQRGPSLSSSTREGTH